MTLLSFLLVLSVATALFSAVMRYFQQAMEKEKMLQTEKSVMVLVDETSSWMKTINDLDAFKSFDENVLVKTGLIDQQALKNPLTVGENLTVKIIIEKNNLNKAIIVISFPSGLTKARCQYLAQYFSAQSSYHYEDCEKEGQISYSYIYQ